MAEQPRNKGQFVQPGSLVMVAASPAGSGNSITHDGTLACDTAYLQVDYPVLFSVLGIAYNSAGKGDNDATQFRTPPAPAWSNDTNWVPRVRF